MKIVELNEKEMMSTNGGGKGCSLNERSCRSGKGSGGGGGGSWGSRDNGCKRDWGGVAAGAGKALAGGIGYAATFFGNDGSKSRIDHIREATCGLAKSGWNQMGDSFKCKKR